MTLQSFELILFKMEKSYPEAVKLYKIPKCSRDQIIIGILTCEYTVSVWASKHCSTVVFNVSGHSTGSDIKTT